MTATRKKTPNQRYQQVSRRITIAISLALLVAGASLAAAPGPSLTPNRDAELVYAVGGRMPTGQTQWSPALEHVRVKAGEPFIRVDSEKEPNSYMLVDRANRTAIYVRSYKKAYFQVPFGPWALDRAFATDPTLTFTKIGPDVFEGRPCTRWTARGQRSSGTACVADDGTMLSADGETGYWTNGTIALRSATYTTQARSLFITPPDYTVITKPFG